MLQAKESSQQAMYDKGEAFQFECRMDYFNMEIVFLAYQFPRKMEYSYMKIMCRVPIHTTERGCSGLACQHAHI